MAKYNVAGLLIDSLTKQEVLQEISARMDAGQTTFMTTPYSEFLYRGLRGPGIFDMLNRADIAVPDGIGIFLAKHFLRLPLTKKSYLGKILEASAHMAKILVRGAFRPGFLKSEFPEKIPGSDFIWDLADLASRRGWSMYLLGGFGDTPRQAAGSLKARFPKLIIAGTSSKNPDDPTIAGDIASSHPDMLLVAYGPIRQEQWIAGNKDLLPAKFFIGLGGTFDYLAKNFSAPHAAIRSRGLEWLYRLITQPKRFRRIWQATAGLIRQLVLYKVMMTLPYRQNVVSVIINPEGKVFVGLRKPDGKERNNNHWMFPQGGLETGEDLTAGARREIAEEIGVHSLEFLKKSDSVNRYYWTPGYNNKFKGQEQQIVYFRFTGTEKEIKFDTHHTAEFVDYQWAAPEALPSIIHPLRKPLDSLVLRDLKNMP